MARLVYFCGTQTSPCEVGLILIANWVVLGISCFEHYGIASAAYTVGYRNTLNTKIFLVKILVVFPYFRIFKQRI